MKHKRRHKMTKRHSKHVFKRTARPHHRNLQGANMSMRGGIRL